MATWFFVSDLHDGRDRYRKLFDRIADEQPAAVLFGGDLLPTGAGLDGDDDLPDDFINDFLRHHLASLRTHLGSDYPRVLLILGNDDPRSAETRVRDRAGGIWEYIHNQRVTCHDRDVYGYACVPPTPFQLKDFERYDVSRYVDPGCISPEAGVRTVDVPSHEVRYGTIKEDLAKLTAQQDVSDAIFLFHTPPYQTTLDRAALDGKMIDHVPLDVHVGSIAVRRFIEQRQPRITLHGHVHESARLTGAWRDRIRHTHCLSAAHDGPELALVRFDPDDPAGASRELI